MGIDQNFGVSPADVTPFNWLFPANPIKHGRERLAKIVHETCRPETRERWNVIIVSYLDLNANAANFYSLRDSLTTGVRCRYTSLDLSAERTVPEVLARIVAIGPASIVTIKPELQPPPDVINVLAGPVTEALATDPRFVPARGAPRDYLIYRLR